MVGKTLSNRFATLCAGVLICAVAVACSGVRSDIPAGGGSVAKEATPPSAAAKPPVKIKVALSNPLFTPGLSFMWIGNKMGYYRENGVDPEFVGTQGASEATQWLAAGRVDFAVPPPSQMLLSASQGQDLGLVAVYLFNRRALYSFAVKTDSPIYSVSQLKGKKIGIIALADEGKQFVAAAFRELAFNPDRDYELIAVGSGAQAVRALNNGDVDAIAIPDVHYATAEAEGLKVKYLPQPEFAETLMANVVLTRREFLERNREVVVGFLRGMAQGTLFLTSNPEAALKIHLDLYPETRMKGVSEQEGFSRQLLVVTKRAPKLALERGVTRWGDMKKDQWEFYLQYVGLAGKIPDVTRFYTTELLDDVNNFDQNRVIQEAKNYR